MTNLSSIQAEDIQFCLNAYHHRKGKNIQKDEDGMHNQMGQMKCMLCHEDHT